MRALGSNQVFEISLDPEWYRENPGYATFEDYLEEFLESKFKNRHTLKRLR
ncbi:hypothetical protein PP304_gp169 [Gordonia phage Phendrix]|uniref:Uncharacterized protein n=1 Tax=Gordonia phage Phendrix TaxID=2593335 RepID=A0A514U179_9CAUD|nr:hypothetical protein PP304_gp169 [Gordonia phage Phendrix]QDK02700.1 hypothetical protein SEA_PHENDRIX_184 [Gordonia phage Phendrix]